MTLVKLQVRQIDQVWYQHQLQVSSLAGDLQWCSCPLLSTEVKSKQYIPKISPVISRVTHTVYVQVLVALGVKSAVNRRECSSASLVWCGFGRFDLTYNRNYIYINIQYQDVSGISSNSDLPNSDGLQPSLNISQD